MKKISQPTNQKPKLITKIPGEKSAALRAEEKELIADGLQGFAQNAGIVVKRAYGNIVEDIDGNQFIDIIGGIGVNGLGHSHPRFVNDIQNQVKEASVGSFSSMPRINFLKKLKEVALSSELYRMQFYSEGAAAVESALRLAKDYTQKWELASFHGGFHGKTHGVLALMGSDFKKPYAPFAPGNHVLTYADCYRCPFKTTYPSCGLLCVEANRKQLKANVTKGLAAMIMEPMQGTAGNIVPPNEFMKEMIGVAKEFDALFIADEMITGFGRTGKFWGTQHSCTNKDVLPDIMTVGKQFGGGYPISGIITTSTISKTKPWGNPSGSSSSYGANPLALAAAHSALSIIVEEDLPANAKNMGEYFLSKISHYVEKYPFIGKVDGRGLFMCIELVEDKKTKIPLAKKQTEQLFDLFLQHGLLTMAYAPSFRIQPPMTIDKDTIDNIVTVMDNVFDKFC